MPLSLIALGTLGVFALGFLFYSRLVARTFALDDTRTTPAVAHADGIDYVPTRPAVLLAQHFASISAAGPIVGPILAALWFGWAPALAWIIVGAVLVGASHDFAALVASMRHDAHSITVLVREHVGRRAYALFLLFIYLSLIYVIVAFTDLTARQFVVDTLPGVDATRIGGGVATSSVLYLVLAMAMGFALEKLKLGLLPATALFVPALFAVIWVGQHAPLWWPAGVDPVLAWNVTILAYCAFASVLPMWTLLQPRGYLGGYFLYVTLVAGFAGLVLGDFDLAYPAFVGLENPQGLPMFPILFVTIACGACSGFHGLVASGTTSKQLERETHARLVGYGGMLLEGVIAMMALATVMVLAPGDPAVKRDATLLFAEGLGRFLGVFGIPPGFGVAFGMLAFATFVYDTLDVATRLGRYIIEELTGWSGRAGRWLATGATLLLPAAYLIFMPAAHDAAGKPIPAWRVIWPVFGTSNQLLAALTLLAITVWLARTGRSVRFIALPMVFMFVMTLWSLGLTSRAFVAPLLSGDARLDAAGLNGLIATGLLGLGLWLAVESGRVLLGVRRRAGGALRAD